MANWGDFAGGAEEERRMFKVKMLDINHLWQLQISSARLGGRSSALDIEC